MLISYSIHENEVFSSPKKSVTRGNNFWVILYMFQTSDIWQIMNLSYFLDKVIRLFD